MKRKLYANYSCVIWCNKISDRHNHRRRNKNWNQINGLIVSIRSKSDSHSLAQLRSMARPLSVTDKETMGPVNMAISSSINSISNGSGSISQCGCVLWPHSANHSCLRLVINCSTKLRHPLIQPLIRPQPSLCADDNRWQPAATTATTTMTIEN